ncbi:hypothetical protein [Jiulongibacter sediminis]|uniref:hypothetical protein n=1 Tax=Jiulongibacter sediminis TaxID=1605367 RepID=UPI0006DBDFDB|nr:hypothetical protein [Jiulongibacter sediminis]
MRKSLLTILFSLTLLGAFAQQTPQPPEEEEVFFEQPQSDFKQRLHYGGNLWLGFFGAFYLDASPMVGYEITDIGTTAGLGASFIYQGGFNTGGSFMAGPRIFIRQPIWRSIFAHAEFELMNAPENQFYSYNQDRQGIDIGRKWEGSPLIGAGFYQGRTRQQGGSFISVMYNIGYAYNRGFISPQGLGGNSSPFILRFGFFF